MMLPLLLSLANAGEPQLWSVAGVAADDKLHIRKTASASAEIVGDLAPGTGSLVELEQNEEGWVRVRSGTVEGWVNGKFLAPVAPATGLLPATLTCGGTEPFWTIQLADGKAKVNSPDRPTAPELPFSSTKATHDAAFLVTPRGKGPGYSWLTVSLAPQQCSDGMSSTRYGWSTLALTAEHGFVSGCCRVLQ